MSIQQQVLLRYRSEGHLRFDLPALLCTPENGARLAARLRAMEGIYRVDLSVRRGKLSIRYLETVCDFAAVVRGLHALVGEFVGRPAAVKGGSSAPRPARASVPAGRTDAPAARWLRAKLEEAGETVAALGILARRGFKALTAARPRWVTDFLNDLLMLYLIKIHWHHILHLWLPNPWRHRYEWAATFYLIYLSVQARLPKPA